MGRPKGALNVTTKAARAVCLKILEDPEYRQSIARRIKNDALPAAVECLMWHYAYGKPTEKMEVHVSGDELQDLSSAQLAARASSLAKMIKKDAEKEQRELEQESSQVVH